MIPGSHDRVEHDHLHTVTHMAGSQTPHGISPRLSPARARPVGDGHSPRRSARATPRSAGRGGSVFSFHFRDLGRTPAIYSTNILTSRFYWNVTDSITLNPRSVRPDTNRSKVKLCALMNSILLNELLSKDDTNCF